MKPSALAAVPFWVPGKGRRSITLGKRMFDLARHLCSLCEGGHPSPFRLFGDHNPDAYFGNNGTDQRMEEAGVKVDGWGFNIGIRIVRATSVTLPADCVCLLCFYYSN